MWFILALLSAVFAALTSILAKVGIEGVNSNLATAIRTAVVLPSLPLMKCATPSPARAWGVLWHNFLYLQIRTRWQKL